MIKSYRDLEVWQRAVDFAVMVYKATEAFPQSEVYGLTGQLRRASVSIASNIAEGHGRPNPGFARYLRIAIGSVSEVETQLEISQRIGYIDTESFERLSSEVTIIGKQLNALLKKVVQSLGK
jgi:four helix bundle protein